MLLLCAHCCTELRAWCVGENECPTKTDICLRCCLSFFFLFLLFFQTPRKLNREVVVTSHRRLLTKNLVGSLYNPSRHRY
jgi:hypothetical protein